MSGDEITKAEALYALALSPFVLACAVAITIAVCAVLWREKREPGNPYMDIVERARGERRG